MRKVQVRSHVQKPPVSSQARHDPAIVAREVVTSAPNAAIQVTVLQLAPDVQRGLTVGIESLGPVK